MESINKNKRNRREMCLICGLNFNSSASASFVKEKDKKLDQVDMNKMYRIFCKYFHVDQDQDQDTTFEKPSEFLNLHTNTTTSNANISSNISKMNSSNQTRKRGKTRSKQFSSQSQSQNMIEVEKIEEVENLSFPFCPECTTDSVIKLCGLNEQLTVINRNIQNVVTQISSKIIQSQNQSQSQKVTRHESQKVTRHESQHDAAVNSIRNVLTARRRIFSRWNPMVKLHKLGKEKENQPTTSIPVPAQADLQSSETENTDIPMDLDEDVDEITMTTTISLENVSATGEKEKEQNDDDENDIMILNDRSETEDENEIQLLKEILHKDEDHNVDSTTVTQPCPHPETPTTPKPLKSILKTSTANSNNQTPTSRPTLDSSSAPIISSNFTLPRRIVYCGNGKFIFGGYSFYKCADGFLCGVARCPFLTKFRNRMLSHVIQKHAGKSKFVHQRFPPYTTTVLSQGQNQITTPQRKPQNPKPRRTKLSFSHKIAIKIEKLTDSISDSISSEQQQEQQQEDSPLPEPVQIPTPASPKSSSSLPTSPAPIPYVKIEKLRDSNKIQNPNNCKSNTNDRNRNKVRLSKAMALLLEFQKRK